MRFTQFLALLLGCLFLTKVQAADTLTITLQQADSTFLIKNFDLLVAGLNIDSKKAAEIQSKLYPNPLFTADYNAYDPTNHRAFHLGPTGQQSYQLSQLILLGGKRKTWIDLAQKETQIAEVEFQELLKNLKFQLRTSLFYLDQHAALIHKYDNQIGLLSTIIDAYEMQAKKGNFPIKDVVRLKGLSLNLRSQKAELIRQYADEMLKVQMLLQTDQIVKPIIKSTDFSQKIKVFSEADLVQIAKANRPDLQLAEAYKAWAAQAVVLEKKMAIPDLNLISSYDQRGGAFANQVNVGFSMNLPTWNRNQGRIKMAEIQSDQKDIEIQQKAMQVETEVKGYFSNYLRAISDYENANSLYSDDFDFTAQGMIQEFQKGNIGLIEFVDFFESYNEALGDYSKIKVQLGIAAEQLNYTVGKDIL
jgi:cobalt-zinc-cadmium efflux system outer membrane protein